MNRCRRGALALGLTLLSTPVAGAEDAALERVRALLARAPLVDGHNDLPWTLRERFGGDLAKVDLEKRGATVDTDLPRLREGGVSAQFWSALVKQIHITIPVIANSG